MSEPVYQIGRKKVFIAIKIFEYRVVLFFLRLIVLGQSHSPWADRSLELFGSLVKLLVDYFHPQGTSHKTKNLRNEEKNLSTHI